MSDKNLISNPTKRMALCLCIDNSSSMQNENIDRINQYLASLYKKLLSDERLVYSYDLCLVTTGDEHVRCISEFLNVSEGYAPPILAAKGINLLCEGVSFCLDLLSERMEEYKAFGLDYYSPRLMIISDGACEYDGKLFSMVRSKMSRQVSSFGLKVISVVPNNTLIKDNQANFFMGISSLIYRKEVFNKSNSSIGDKLTSFMSLTGDDCSVGCKTDAELEISTSMISHSNTAPDVSRLSGKFEDFITDEFIECSEHFSSSAIK